MSNQDLAISLFLLSKSHRDFVEARYGHFTINKADGAETSWKNSEDDRDKIFPVATVKKKTPKEYFELIKAGKKKIEVRVADFKIKEGDTLVLEEWDAKRKRYTGRKLKKKAGYILKFPLNKFGQKKLIEKHGLYIIQLEE